MSPRFPFFLCLLCVSCTATEPVPLPRDFFQAIAVDQPAGTVAWLGVETAVPQPMSLEDLDLRPGLQVVAIQRGSPAEAAGVQIGDFLLAFQGAPTDDPARLERLLEGVVEPGPASLRLERQGRVLELQADLVLREIGGKTLYWVERGLLRVALRDTRTAGAYPEVVHLFSDSPLVEAGVVPGDRIVSFQGRDPGSAAELARRISIALEPGDPVVLELLAADGEGRTVSCEAWNPGRIITRLMFWPLFAWNLDTESDREEFELVPLFLFSLYSRVQLGGEVNHRVLGVISWESEEMVLEVESVEGNR